MCGNFSSGAARPRDLKPTTPDARAILLSNVCGSFVGIEPLAQLLDLEARHQVETGRTDDHREAARAFVEKRPPKFVGR